MSDLEPADKVRRRIGAMRIPEADKSLQDAFDVLREACEEDDQATRASELSSAAGLAAPGESRSDKTAN